MARYLGCETSVLKRWELEQHCPKALFDDKIRPLMHSHDQQIWRLKQTPAAEEEMTEEGITQVRYKIAD